MGEINEAWKYNHIRKLAGLPELPEDVKMIEENKSYREKSSDPKDLEIAELKKTLSEKVHEISTWSENWEKNKKEFNRLEGELKKAKKFPIEKTVQNFFYVGAAVLLSLVLIWYLQDWRSAWQAETLVVCERVCSAYDMEVLLCSSDAADCVGPDFVDHYSFRNGDWSNR